MVLDEGIDALSLEDVTINNIVFDVVAIVQHKRQINDQSGAVAIAVAAGIGVIGRQTVISPEFVLIQPVNNDAATGAHRVGGVILESSHGVEFILMECVRVNGEIDDAVGVIGVLVNLSAALHQGGGQQSQNDGDLVFHGAKIFKKNIPSHHY